MSARRPPSIQIGNSDWGFIAIVLFIIAFWGEPDLVDALIHFLMRP